MTRIPPPLPWSDPETPLMAIATQEIVYLAPEDTLLEAVRLLADARISSLLVLDTERHARGILTEDRLLRAMREDISPQTALQEVMEAPALVPATINRIDAYLLCLREGVRHLILVDPEQRAVAVASASDFHRHLDVDLLSGQTWVSAIMSRSPCTAPPETSLEVALEQMHNRLAEAIIVTERHHPVGILSRRDLPRLYLAISEGKEKRPTLRQVMSGPVQTLTMETTLAEAARTMRTHQIRQQPVVDGSGRLVGLVTIEALTQALLFGKKDGSPRPGADPFPHLLAQAPFPLIITRLADGLICDLNPRAESQFDLKKEELLGTPVAPLYSNPEDRRRLLAILQRDGSVFDLELSLTNAKGDSFQALVSSSLIEYEHQPAILTAINDITQQKHYEEDLLFHNILLTTQQEASIDGILVVDQHGRILSYNRRFVEMWAVPNHLLQLPQEGALLNFVASRTTNPETFLQHVHILYSQRHQTDRESVQLADGRIFDRYTAPMFGPDRHYFGRIWFFRDITEDQQARQQLEHERAKLRGLIQNIPALLWLKDAEGRFLLCNSEFEKIIATNEADIRGLTDYDLVSRERADFYRANDLQAIATGGPVKHEEWIEFADGHGQGLFETIKTPLLDENGVLIGVLGIGRDVTQHRREQRDLRERIKEQQCLYRIFALTEDVHLPFDEQLQQVVDSIPMGWQFPEITSARIVYGQETYTTHDFEESASMQTVEAATSQGEMLQLTVGYRNVCPQEDEGPFLREERELAQAIVHRLAEVAERRSTLEAIKVRDQLIACMFAQTTDAIVLIDAQSHRFVDFNHVAHTSLGYTYEEFAQLRIQDIQDELSLARINGGVARVLQGEVISHETRHRHKNGTLRDVALTLRSLSLQGKKLFSAVWQDVTEQKVRQQELEESQKRLKAITDSALDAIMMMDCRGIVSYWNPAAEQILGYRADEALGKHLHRLLAPSRYHAEHQAAFLDFLKTGKGKAVGKTIELAALHKDGREIPISLSLSSVLIQNQWHAVGILRDISVQKQVQAELKAALGAAEAAIQEKSEILVHLEEMVEARTQELDAANEQFRISEERYALALEASSDGLWDWNLTTDSVYCSSAYYRMLGYEPGELPPDRFASGMNLVHPEDRDLVSTALEQQLIGKGALELEFRMLSKTGEVVWVLSRCKVVSRDAKGRAIRAVGIHTDLTARKRIESQLRTAAIEQQAIFNAAGSGIFLITNRAIMRCNRKLEEIFGYSRGELTGKSTEVWYQSHAEFLRWGQEIMHALLTAGIFHSEIQLRRKDGSLFWGRTTAQPLDMSDLSKGVVGMLEDITQERKVAETLRKAKEDAEAATRAKTKFLANMSHEIRTPLNAILGFTHLIRRDPLSPQQTNQLDKLAAASHHLQKIINDVLDLSKIEADKMALDNANFSLPGVIDQVCTIAAPRIQSQKLHLHADITQIPDWLRGDGARLRQILLNLLDNAVKFTEQGRIDIRARVVQQSPESIVLRFTVQDTGIGMRDDQLARIFQAFEQADSSTTRRFGGTGLGLAICKQLVELMGGGIGVESQLGVGTLFWVEIPFAPAEEAMPNPHGADIALHRGPIEHATPSPDAEQMQEAALAQRRGSRILLVEDNFVNQEVAYMLLESMGMEVEVADNGKAALALVAKKPFDLVFMDIQMPVMDGLEATTAIRRLPDRQAMPILAMTANAFVEDRERCLQAGMNDHIAKPIELEKLRTLLIEWLMPRTATKPSPRPAVSATDATDIPAQLNAIEGLDVDAGLRLLRGNVEGYLRLLVQFSKQHGGDAQRMATSARAGDWPTLRAQSHALKGAAATLGISNVAHLAESLEMTAKSSTALHAIPPMIAAIQSALHRFMDAVHHITIPAAATPAAPVDPAQIRQILERLASLLAIEDSAANDEFDQARPLLAAAFGPQAELLGHQIESYDYNEAQQTVRSLLQC